jgi:hypothetical protein
VRLTLPMPKRRARRFPVLFRVLRRVSSVKVAIETILFTYRMDPSACGDEARESMNQDVLETG